MYQPKWKYFNILHFVKNFTKQSSTATNWQSCTNTKDGKSLQPENTSQYTKSCKSSKSNQATQKYDQIEEKRNLIDPVPMKQEFPYGDEESNDLHPEDSHSSTITKLTNNVNCRSPSVIKSSSVIKRKASADRYELSYSGEEMDDLNSEDSQIASCSKATVSDNSSYKGSLVAKSSTAVKRKILEEKVESNQQIGKPGDAKRIRPPSQKSLEKEIDIELLKCLKGTNAKTATPKKENVAEDDPVKLYCLSLVHQFRKLSGRKQRSARIQIEQVFAGLDSSDSK